MRKSKTIILPRILSLQPYAKDWETGQQGVITLQKAKDIVFAAVLNDDVIHLAQDDVRGIAIEIIDRDEFERTKGDYEITITDKQPVEVEP